MDLSMAALTHVEAREREGERNAERMRIALAACRDTSDDASRSVRRDADGERLANERGHANAQARSLAEREWRKSERFTARQADGNRRPDKREREAAREARRERNALTGRALVYVKGRAPSSVPVHIPSMQSVQRVNASAKNPGNGNIRALTNKRAEAFGLLPKRT